MTDTRAADCCAHCANIETDFLFRDAVLCRITSYYQFKTETCDEFKRKEAEKK